MMLRTVLGFLLSVNLVSLAYAGETDDEIIKATSLAEFGEPALPNDFEHLPYANPEAPKGGEIVLSAFGSFDTLNPYVLKGVWPSSIGLAYCSLMSNSSDELASLYSEVAESVEYPEDKSWIIFNLREEAKYHDGSSIVADDFVFALETIKEHGRPFLQSFYEDIEKAEALNDLQVKYYFKTKNNMKPVILAASASPSSRKYWQDKDITESTLEPPLGCGAYKLTKVDPGRSVTYTRVKNWWGENLPTKIGLNNFDTIRYDYYLDETVAFEAFRAGDIDFRTENSSKRWATEYNIEAIKNGEMIKQAVPDATPQGLSGVFINSRRNKFKDVNVRKALVYIYDFEAIQRALLFGFYKRIQSNFPNSDFGANGQPTQEELAILNPYREELNPLVLTEEFKAPVTDGSGRNRENKRKAINFFKQAGWNLEKGRLVNVNGEQFELEIMIPNSSDSERVTQPYIESLKNVGIDASIRKVDTSQRRERINDWDYDTFTARYNFFPPPGPELRSYYGCEAANLRGSANTMGICNPVVDELIEQIINAKDIEILKATTRAMDRIILQGYYAIPLFYNDENWIAYWDKFGKPEQKPKYSVGFPGSWWMKQ